MLKRRDSAPSLAHRFPKPAVELPLRLHFCMPVPSSDPFCEGVANENVFPLGNGALVILQHCTGRAAETPELGSWADREHVLLTCSHDGASIPQKRGCVSDRNRHAKPASSVGGMNRETRAGGEEDEISSVDDGGIEAGPAPIVDLPMAGKLPHRIPHGCARVSRFSGQIFRLAAHILPIAGY